MMRIMIKKISLIGFIFSVLLLISSCGGRSDSDGEQQQLRIHLLSNRAELISGGDALVEILLPGGIDTRQISVMLNDTDVSNRFARHAVSGRFLGLVNGLTLGENRLAVYSDSRQADDTLTIINHPISGPVFSGEQVQPWICQTEASGFSSPLDEHCNVAPQYEYYYKSSNPLLSGFQPYDLDRPPADIALTTTDEGKTLPFIVRTETGVINRGWYVWAFLFDPDADWTAQNPQAGWNGKLVWHFGSGCERVTFRVRRQIFLAQVLR